MRRRREFPPSRLGQLGDLHVFDQSNALDAPPEAEERFSQAAHLVAPESLNTISRHFH